MCRWWRRRTARVSDGRAKPDPSLPSELEEVFKYEGSLWKETAGRNIAGSLPAREVLRQEAIHGSLSGKMRDLQEEGPLIGEMGDLLLSQLGVAASEELRQAVLKGSLQQARGREILQEKQQRDARFRRVIQEIESSPECHQRQLASFLDCELQRLASYPLLLNQIIQHTNKILTLMVPLKQMGIFTASKPIYFDVFGSWFGLCADL
ncbi:rho guanine nucleotide exchange factor 11-like [Podarcis lilfordi]|uniref:Rho guanine nucleotide exchange factor 11-like n=1 Tax=Podarcis lilfordi TaxID=74358 RepID=A0AA35LC24_9SAUR|nr:rho guanine nucleotide exchange factor 11-like [Podarcis lilfordi]